MFHLLNYTVSAGVNALNTDMAASVDVIFSQRNAHYVFTEPYRVLAFMAMGTSVLRIRSNIPTWNALARHVIDPPNRSATVPSNPQGQWFLDYPLQLPLNEEVAFETSNDLGAATEQEDLWLWIADPSWNQNLPRGRQIITARFTATAAGTANVWGAAAAITFAEQLRGGVYSVCGAEVFDSGTKAFRLIFPKAPLIQGRALRPGTLCREAIGNVPFGMPYPGPYAFGVWGRFHTFEVPQIEIFANATAASTQEGRLYMVYEGEQNTL